MKHDEKIALLQAALTTEGDGAIGALERVTSTFAAAMQAQQRDALASMERLVAMQQELVTQALDRCMSVTSPQAAALAGTLARARAASGPVSDGQRRAHAPSVPPEQSAPPTHDDDDDRVPVDENVVQRFAVQAAGGVPLASFDPRR